MKSYLVIAHVEFEVDADNDEEMVERINEILDYPIDARIRYEQIDFEEVR